MWQGGLFLDGSSTSPESTLLSFQMMALNGASKYLPSPKATLFCLVLGEQWLMDAKKSTFASTYKEEHPHVLRVLLGELNSMRLTPASSSNRVIAFCSPSSAEIQSLRSLLFFWLYILRKSNHSFISWLSCSTTTSRNEVSPRHSPVFLQNFFLLIKLLSCRFGEWKFLETQQTSPTGRQLQLHLETMCPNLPHWPGLTLARNTKDKPGLENVNPFPASECFLRPFGCEVSCWSNHCQGEEGPFLKGPWNQALEPFLLLFGLSVMSSLSQIHDIRTWVHGSGQMKYHECPVSKAKNQQKKTQMKFMVLVWELMSLLAWGYHSQQDLCSLCCGPLSCGIRLRLIQPKLMPCHGA